MAFIDTEKLFDVEAREILLDRSFGPHRFSKTSERFREGRLPADGLSLVARVGDRLVGTLRFWHVRAGDRPALVLGPVAIDPAFRSLGLGGEMIRAGLKQATALGHEGVILVGDAAYYQRFGFERRFADNLVLPGPVQPERFLGLELASGSLEGAAGLVVPTGAIPLRTAPSGKSLQRAA